MPEVMPPAVTILPASTTRARLILHAGAMSARRSIGTLPGGDFSTLSGSLRLVAGKPSRRPIFPYTHEPVHTLVKSVESGRERTNSCRRRLYVSCLVPKPPGIRNASMAGASEEGKLGKTGNPGCFCTGRL